MIIGNTNDGQYIDVYECFNISDYYGDFDEIIDECSLFKEIEALSDDKRDTALRSIMNNLVVYRQEGLLFALYVFRNLGESYLRNLFNLAQRELCQDKKLDNLGELKYLIKCTDKMSGFDSLKDFLDPCYEALRLKHRGITLTDSGYVKHFNPNIYCRLVSKRFRFATLKGVIFYVYDRRGFWKEIDEIRLRKLLRDVFHEALPDTWILEYEAAYMQILRQDAVYLDRLNPNRDYINLNNGMLNIYTKELIPHRPEFYFSAQVPINYNPEATAPIFTKTVNEIMGGNVEKINVLKEEFGYCLTAKKLIQMAFFWTGYGGNGKSLLAFILMTLLGKDNVTNLSQKVMSSRFGLTTLPGKLLNLSPENSFSKKQIESEIFKSIVGDDPVSIEPKGKDIFNTNLECKLILLLNKMPDTDDLTEGNFRRIHILTFAQKFVYGKGKKGKQADLNLKEKLVEELEGILNFALSGLDNLIKNNFVISECAAVNEAVLEYKECQSPVYRFFNTVIEYTPNSKLKKSNVYKVFKEWAEENGLLEESKIGTNIFWSQFKMFMAEKDIEYVVTTLRGIDHILHIAIKGEYLRLSPRDVTILG